MDPMSIPTGRVIVITGAMAAGKSTVAGLLSSRLHRVAHVRGDVFRRMIVNGRADMAPEPSSEAQRQLALRYDLAAHTADAYAAAGIDAIVQDVIIGPDLQPFMDRISTRPRHLVVLSPSVTALQWREEQRAKAGYVHFGPDALDEVLRSDTARIGYWLDSSAQTPDETVTDILTNLEKAEV